MKKYWTALAAIIASALIYQLLVRYIPSSWSGVLSIVWMVMLLLIGYFLSPHSKKNNRWLGKVIIAILVVVIVGYRMNAVEFAVITNTLNKVGLTGQFLDIILIYCGWAFFQV